MLYQAVTLRISQLPPSFSLATWKDNGNSLRYCKQRWGAIEGVFPRHLAVQADERARARYLTAALEIGRWSEALAGLKHVVIDALVPRRAHSQEILRTFRGLGLAIRALARTAVIFTQNHQLEIVTARDE